MGNEIQLMTYDNFLPEHRFQQLRELADTAEFKDTVSPYDGATYPDLFMDIPDKIRQAVIDGLSRVVGKVHSPIMFMRKSSRGVPVPHQVHSDAVMGEGTLFIYLNREEHCVGGTGLVIHKETGMYYHPVTEEELSLLHRDMHNQEMWDTYHLLKMHPNRAAVMPSHLLHRAEPVGGFGDTNEDSRVVLICFFGVSDD